MRYDSLAVPDARDLVFGRAPYPLRCGLELELGAGAVFPEVNFTLPPIAITDATWPDILAQYREMTEGVLQRAQALQVPGLVLEFEHLPPMSSRPQWGAEITAVLCQLLRQAHEAGGLPCALRATVVDLRHEQRPPRLRDGPLWETMRRSFADCAEAGADILSIESVGGKEVFDETLLRGDIRGLVLALGVLAPRDMAWLWQRIAEICDGNGGAIAGGDSACGFANTAMQLAGQRFLPEVLAAVVRAMGASRSLVAFENGAVGPSKDCAYEGPVIKAITGRTISMEGKSATCAHFSPLGNIAAAACDLWSNESVQNVRLLSGSAPQAFTESLIYDCRLMNEALRRGQERSLRDLLVDSDQYHSPQALVISPQASVAIAKAIVAVPSDYQRCIAAAQAAVALIREAVAQDALRLSPVETRWLGRIDSALAGLPSDEGQLLDETAAEYASLFESASYGL
ncbi:MAG TPA: methyltransferase MtaB domain-containing protein [Dehalococcoidia bacterium]|nr:methyltransferase MtaB domain-containing protein [Dehalococcoidia bacterium]